MFILGALVIVTFGTLRASACVRGETTWVGGAPICGKPECPMGWQAMQYSDCGDGVCCMTGHKVLCRCAVADGCSQAWYGSAPFCTGSSCPSGWIEIGRDSSGDGAQCWFGTKAHCSLCPEVPKTVQLVVNQLTGVDQTVPRSDQSQQLVPGLLLVSGGTALHISPVVTLMWAVILTAVIGRIHRG